jgi:membrane fusion protein, multidrug efflux system
LKNAKTNLSRTRPLADRSVATQQLLDTQNSQVAQGEGSVALDKAALEAAQAQLSFTTITAPFDGVTGILRGDPGNIVQSLDPNGLVVLTQVQPSRSSSPCRQAQFPRCGRHSCRDKHLSMPTMSKTSKSSITAA